jgi:hypothetical protein
MERTMTTTATHLRTIALHWTDLHDAAGQPVQLGAFGLGLRGYLAALDDADRAEYYRAHRAWRHSHDRDPLQLGDRPVPVRLHILDTMRTVETLLVQCADDIAHAAQRTPIAGPTARRTAVAPYLTQREADIAAADRARRAELAHTDLADPRRWRYTGSRTAQDAALWLLARVQRAPGPCRRITSDEEARIGRVATRAAEQVERALDIAAQQRTLEQPCPCGGQIDVHGGEGRPPLAHCTGCGRIWTEGGVVAA